MNSFDSPLNSLYLQGQFFTWQFLMAEMNEEENPFLGVEARYDLTFLFISMICFLLAAIFEVISNQVSQLSFI